MGEAVVISPTIIVVIFLVGRDEFLQYFLQILNQTGLVLDRGEGRRGAGYKKRSQTVLNLFFFDLLPDLSRDVYDIAKSLSLLDYFLGLDFYHGWLTISHTLLSSSPILDGSFPPAWAKSVRPPPP